MAISVLIAESSELLSAVLAETLTLLGFTVVGKTSKRSQLNALVIEAKPDLLIYDLRLSDGSSDKVKDITDIKAQLPEMKVVSKPVVALGIHEYLLEPIKNAGFDGYWNIYGKRSEFTNLLTILFP
jgi:DNA-binding NarL/FixJ family response regulator